jgi:CelD/BcsL family acetyltransferase involved in cellulose biosynthesis
MARASAGGETFGMLYNFVQSGVVYFYQSGFLYEDDNRAKPGLLTHALVIQSCLDQGFERYDFLASDPLESRYKASLSTDEAPLAWTAFRRRTVRTAAFVSARRIKRFLSARGAASNKGDHGGA